MVHIYKHTLKHTYTQGAGNVPINLAVRGLHRTEEMQMKSLPGCLKPERLLDGVKVEREKVWMTETV